MAGVQAVGATPLPPVQFQTERLTRLLNLQKDAIALQGDLALKLIQSAVVATDTGNLLDVRI